MPEHITDLVITSEKLSVEDATNIVSSPTCGATSVFIGTTRNYFDGKMVLSLDYECYTSMAKKEMAKIVHDIRIKWPAVKHVAIHHRIGNVPIQEASIVIAISSAHRQDAMSASQYCIDTLKASVPIWKKEQYADGCSNWKENKECKWTGKSPHD